MYIPTTVIDLRKPVSGFPKSVSVPVGRGCDGAASRGLARKQSFEPLIKSPRLE